MIIENKEIAARIRLGIMLYVLAYLLLLVSSIIFAWSPKHYFQYILTSLFILSFVFLFLKKYSYVYYNDNGIKIILRFSSLLPLSVGNYSIEVPKKDFVKAEFGVKNLGLCKILVLYVSTPQGVAKFKSVSLSALNKKDYANLQTSLAFLAEQNL